MNSAPPCAHQFQYITAPITTFRIGGPADIATWPKNSQELIETIQWANSHQFPITLLGGGSNVLIADKGIRGVLILTSEMNTIEEYENPLEYAFGAGCDVQKLVFWSAENNLAGLEFAGGLPGSLGGAVWMNARAYGSEFSEIVSFVEAVNEWNRMEYFTKDQMEFEYKRSIFQKRSLIITKVRIQFKAGLKSDILNIAQKNINDRNSKKQDKIFSAGCVFKNNYDVGIPSGKLIQDVGLKGKMIGGAKIFEEHANFVINANHAKASDVIQLMKFTQKTIKEKLNVMIYPEVQFIGDYQDELKDLQFG